MSTRLTIAGALLAAATLLALPDARAGTVYLMNGEEIDGDVLDVSVDSVTIRVGGGRVSYPLREVRDVEIRPGASIYERKLKDALDRAKQAKEAERAAKATQNQPKKPPAPLPVGNAPHLITPDVAPTQVDMGRSGILFDNDRYRFALHYPATLQQGEPEPAFLTFQDLRGVAQWSFNVTYFGDEDSVDWDNLRARSQAELDRLTPHYRALRRSTIGIGRFNVERTTGFYERANHAIRHDQLIAPTSRGVLVFNFFSPGASTDANGVPDVEAVIRSIELK